MDTTSHRVSCWRILLLFLFIFLGNSAAEAATRYVDQANSKCSDAGQGTQLVPYCTIQEAGDDAVAGDTVIVNPGVYPERVTIAHSGTSSAPITFTVAKAGSVTVQGQTNGFFLTSRRWITIDGFKVAYTSGNGISLKYCSNITISNNNVSRSGQPVSGYTAHGIFVYGTTNSVLRKNFITYNTDSGILVTGGSTGVTIRANTVTKNARGYTRSASGIDIRSGTNTIKFNISHHNEDSGVQLYTTSTTGNRIVSNLCYNNGDHGIDISRPTNTNVIGNTVYRNVTAGINVEGGATGTTLRNNISVDNGIESPRTVGNIRVDSASISGTSINDDLVYLSQASTMIEWNGARYTSLPAFFKATGQESRGLQDDPLFASAINGNFQLLAGSPAIDSANSAASSASKLDIKFRPRVDDPTTPNTGTGTVGHYDRGAYEFQP